MDVGKQITELQHMTSGQLRQKYEDVFGEPTRTGNKAFLVKRIAWRIQSLDEGTLSERARRRAAELARDSDIRMTMPRGPKLSEGAKQRTTVVPVPGLGDDRLPVVGTILTREYQGRLIQVKVLANGFEYEGDRYKTLSAVAKVVTDTHWNGYVFFGLKPARKESR